MIRTRSAHLIARAQRASPAPSGAELDRMNPNCPGSFIADEPAEWGEEQQRAIGAMSKPPAPHEGAPTRTDCAEPGCDVYSTVHVPAGWKCSLHTDFTPHEDAQADVFEAFALSVLAEGDTTSARHVSECARAKFGPAIELISRATRAGHANEMWALRPEMVDALARLRALAAVVRAQEAKR